LKVNLGRGVYKDDNGKNWVLPSVRLAEKKIFEDKQQHDYLPFKGWETFVKRTSEFAFGADSPLLRDKKVGKQFDTKISVIYDLHCVGGDCTKHLWHWCFARWC